MVDWMGMGIQAAGILLITVAIVIILGIVGVLTWLYKKKQIYKHYKVLIWKRYKDKKGAEIPVIVAWDKGAVKKDKKLKKWVFHVKNWNIDFGEEEQATLDEDRDLDIPSIPHEKGGEVVFIEKVGKRKGCIGEPFIIEGNPKVIVSSADIAEAIRAFDINAKTFGKKDNKLLAFTLYIILAALVLVMIIVILNKFEAIQTAAETFNAGANVLASTKSAAVASGAPG